MSPQLEGYETAVVDTERAGEEYAAAARTEKALQDGRHGARGEAVKRLMEPVPLPNRRDPTKYGNGGQRWLKEDRRHIDGGFPGFGPARASSVSAAEKLVESDPTYAAYLRAERDATYQKNMAYSRLIAARLRALGHLYDLIALHPHPVISGSESVIDLDLIRNQDDRREQLVGGVPL